MAVGQVKLTADLFRYSIELSRFLSANIGDLQQQKKVSTKIGMLFLSKFT